MEKIFNLTSTFKTHAEEDGSVMIRGMASTVDFDRAGDSISAEAWQKGGMANFEKNPIILFNHNYDKPIGRATGLKAGPNGLEMEAKISKHAECAALIKDGVLGAFSVGFRVKDADYIKETDGLMIKDAELFEVSVVSVPCNQSATFSLAKSFDSTEEYEEFKKTFTNRVDLAGQSLAKEEVITSSVASDTPNSAEHSADQEIKMDNTQNIDLEAFAKKVADETAAKIAMKQAEQKAAEQAEAKAQAEMEAARTLEGEKIQATIKAGVETGVEKLMADVEKSMDEKDSSLADTIAKYKTELEEKATEIEAMRNSKKSFDGRGSNDMSKFGKEFLSARLLGAITGKGYDTDYANSIMEKVGTVGASGYAGKLDQITSQTFVDEIAYASMLGGLFDELQVSSGATVLPVTRKPAAASWGTGGAADANALDTAGTAASYEIENVVVNAYRLIASTYVLNDTDEQLVVSLLPQITRKLAEAHAIAIDKSILFGGQAGTPSIGLIGQDGAYSATNAENLSGGTGTNTALAAFPTPVELAGLRSGMGAYGQNANDLAIIINPEVYYSIIHVEGFTDVSEVGSDRATKLTGEIGSIFGIRVIQSDQIAARAASGVGGIMVNTSNFVRPRLAGVNFETEYSVVNQRTNLVASQSVGFNRLIADDTSCRVLLYPAS